MEVWAELISSYPEDPEPRHLTKALRIADNLVSSDLATFEIEWLVSTFLYEPVDVFQIISSKKDNEQWLKNIADAFKIIAKIVNKYWNILENYSECIVEHCMQPYDPQTKKEAINCLINVLRNPGVSVGNARSQINALEVSSTCMAPLALLVGTICRYHPESVDQDYTRIWRIYLKMLQKKDITDTLANAVLQGIDGLFENFGTELPIAELNDFYKNMSRRFAKIYKCIETLLSILKSHAGLFREKLSEDQVLRIYLWELRSPNIKGALISIYTVIFEDADNQRIDDIIRTEIQPRFDAESSLVKHTALRIAMHATIHHQVKIENMFRPDALEFQLRSRMISYQDADLVSVCLASRESYTKSLLVTTIMYYENIPDSLRLDIVTQGIFEASDDNRKVAIHLLVELSRQDGCLEKYSGLWRAILDPDVQKKYVLKETLQHVATLLKSFLDAPVKDIEQVLSLSSVLSFILSVSRTDDTQYCEMLKPIIMDLCTIFCVSPATLLSPKFVCAEMFDNNSILNELLSINNGTQIENINSLASMQILFRKDVADTKLCMKVVSELDNVLKYEKNLDRRVVKDIMKQLLKLKSKKDSSTSDNRALLRNISILAGEHSEFINKDDDLSNVCLTEMKNKLTINITNYELDLLRTLQIALAWEHPDTLYCLLIVITTNLRDRANPVLQMLSWRCIHALFKCRRVVEVTPVLRMCATLECVRLAVDTINNEIDPEVRRLLCDSLQVMLLHEPGSDAMEPLLALVAEQLLIMLNCPDQPIYECGLDISRIFHTILCQNDDLTIKYLPALISLLSRNVSKPVYKLMTDLFIEKAAIFEDPNIKEMVANIIKNMKTNKNKIHLECVLEFLKRIFDVKSYDMSLLVDGIFHGFDSELEEVGDVGVLANVLQILAISQPMFDGDMSKSVLTKNDCVLFCQMATILERTAVETNDVVMSNILKFLNVYAVTLIDIQKEKTIKFLCKLIETMPPTSVPILKNDLSLCLHTYKSILNEIPQEIIYSFRKWCEHLNIEALNEELKEKMSDLFPVTDKSFTDKIKSLSIMCDIFDMPINKTECWTTMLVTNDDKFRHVTVAELLSVSARSLTTSAFANFVKDNQVFVKKYLNVYFEKIVRSDIDMEKDFLACFMKYFVNNYKNYKEYQDDIMDLVEKNWPGFEESSFEDKLALASDVLRVPSVAQVSPVKWVINTITSQTTSLENKVKMITLLPGGDEYSACYRRVAGLLPPRLSEARGALAAGLRALLDSLAATGDQTLLDIVLTLAAADDSIGWWDDAIDACMATLADRRDENIYDAAYSACKKRSGMGCCRRVFVPLLRHSSRSFCEQYTSKIIQELLSTLKMGYKEPSNSDVYRDRVLSYAKVFAILQVVFDKLSPKSLESGILNMNAGVSEPWHLVKTVCICSVTLMDKVRCPDDASDEIRQACLRLQCAAYNCLTTAVCARRPAHRQYSFVFSTTAWANIVDPSVHYEFQPRAYWIGSGNRKQADDTTGPSTSFSGTVRTRIFMTTLSENPLQFDVIPNEDEAEEIQEYKPVGFDAHPLNSNGCLTTIAMLLQHASTLEHKDWLSKVTEGLTANLPLNAKWMIAQAICYVESDLKIHASVLTPALLELVASTPKLMHKPILNNLHIDILWTIIRWNIPDLPSYTHLSLSIQHLIHTCMEYRGQETLSRRLLNTLNGLLLVYGTNVDIPWSVFEEYCSELPQNATHLLPIFQRILKNGIPLPNLLPVILDRFDAKLWPSTPKLPEVFGLALSLNMSEDYLTKFWQILGSIKSQVGGFVKVLLYAQRVYHRCCNVQLFRNIVDLAPKAEKTKCLSIIAVYLEHLETDDVSCDQLFETVAVKELLDGDYAIQAMKVVECGFKWLSARLKHDVLESVIHNCRSGSAAHRRQALAVLRTVFQDLVQIKEENPAKKRALSGTPILNTMESTTRYHQQVIEEVSQGMFDADQDAAKMMRDGVASCLSKDMNKRFAELFYLIFYFAKSDCLDLSEYGYVFLDLLFDDMKQQEGFKNRKYSEQPLPVSDIDFGYTFTSGVTRQRQNANMKQINVIDVQMPVSDMFEVFLRAAKGNSKICEELCVQIMRRLEAHGSSARFDLGEVMASLLAKVLEKPPNCLTPLFLEASRIFLNNLSTTDGFKNSLQVLQSKLRDEPLLYFNIFYEDFILNIEGRNFFDFSVIEDFDVPMKYEDEEFSIENLVETFGNLSNWDDLRLQDKKRIEESLPPLFVGREKFDSILEEYVDGVRLDYSGWFNKMLGAHCSHKLNRQLIQYKENWLKDAQRWPTRDFVISTVIEAMRWPEDTTAKACHIRSSDCLAEWAARLMIRSAYYQQDVSQSVCRADELRWCSEANRRQLPLLALQCIDRNKSCLEEDEALPWFLEKVDARRLLALKTGDTEMLRKTLEAAELQNDILSSKDICLQRLILQLRNDVGSVIKTDLDVIFSNIRTSGINMKNGAVSSTDADNLKLIYNIAMSYYDRAWDESGVSEQEEIVSNMLDIIEQYINYNVPMEHNLIVSILLNKLSHYEGILSEEIAKKFLDKIAPIFPHLDTCSRAHIRNMSHIFPGHIWAQNARLNWDESLGHCKEYLRLICDPHHTLVHFCYTLLKTKDLNDWQSVFNKMKETIFESSYGGTEYISLNNYKNKLYTTEYDNTEERQTTLQSLIKELSAKPVRSGLRLSQVSPALSRPSVLEEEKEQLAKLLALPPTVRVVKFFEHVKVFKDSIRRPCVVSVQLSTGATKRYIIKTGEPLANDASVQRAIAILPRLIDGHVRSYNVTVLSDESALIEYLEDHERLRDLMGDSINIPITRLADESLVLSPSLSLEQYHALCNKLPVNTLRSAIESRCVSTQEFINKKRIFLETLSTMTITNWLFGVGDRHLYNMMWDRTDGGVCAVDWASVFQYGSREFVPARLTANLLALCDVKVLEARLQNILESLRQSQNMYEAFIRISFYWKGRDFSEMNYMRGILQGTMISYQITRDVIQESSIRNRENCIKILDSVFENIQTKSAYSVEEQVSYLLKHCTDPQCLSVIPRGWEPWI